MVAFHEIVAANDAADLQVQFLVELKQAFAPAASRSIGKPRGRWAKMQAAS